MGAFAYKKIQEWKIPDGGVFVEIGSERGEGSTRFLYDHCKERGIDFYTVDCSSEVQGMVSQIENIKSYLSTGEDFLKKTFPKFKQKISFLYLDNFDWIWKKTEKELWILDQIKQYKGMGMEMNNKNSQEAHKKQALLADKFIVPGGIVLLDDTWKASKKEYGGKGGTAVPALIKRGYSIVNKLKCKKEDREGYVCLIKK